MYGSYLNSFIQEFEIKRENNDIIDNLMNYLKETKDNFYYLQFKCNSLITFISLANYHDYIKEDKTITIENKSKNENLEIINKELKEKIDTLNNELKKENEDLKKINKELKEKVDILNNELKKENNINKDLNQKILELVKINKELKEKITIFNNQLNKENNKNKDLKQKILELEKIIDSLAEEKKKKEEKLRDIQEINLKNNNPNSKIIEELLKDLSEKNQEIKQLRNNNYIKLKPGEKLMSIIFLSVDQKIHHSFVCKNTDIFAEIEQKLYVEYPEYKEQENYFIANGFKVSRFKSLDENNIKNSDKITLNIID